MKKKLLEKASSKKMKSLDKIGVDYIDKDRQGYYSIKTLKEIAVRWIKGIEFDFVPQHLLTENDFEKLTLKTNRRRK